MRKPWFALAGIQEGERTVDEQLLGLGPVLAMAPGARVLDLGCAEGAIAREFALRGADTVDAVECNPDCITVGRQVCRGLPIRIIAENLNRIDAVMGRIGQRYDIVLLLAILHKLIDPTAVLRNVLTLARDVVAVRLPIGSTGTFTTKQSPDVSCDVPAVMRVEGLDLWQSLPGPRGELVQLYRRRWEG